MPNIQSAKKAIRVSDRKRVLNDKRRIAMKMEIKKIAKLGKEKSTADLSTVYQAIDKALKQGVIKKNTAARKKARIARSFASQK